jgi:hypothetical protein
MDELTATKQRRSGGRRPLARRVRGSRAAEGPPFVYHPPRMARTFAANRDIKIEASETSAGVFTLRTRGLADKRRPELEVAGVPEVALNGAGGVVNMLAEYTVNDAEVFANQTVGNALAVGDEGRRLLLAVRAVAAAPAKGGLWSKLTGGNKGVLRLVDVAETSGAPLTAIATMLVHRAAVRLAKDDEAGAREELEAAIAAFPGEPGRGEPPTIGGSDGLYNWQNHVAYLDLATLAGDDVDMGAARFGEALARSPELARRHLGASVDDVQALTAEDVKAAAALILEHNLRAVHRGAGPTDGMITLASPIWEQDHGHVSRRASVLPAALLAIYYEGATAERLRAEGAELVTRIVVRDAARPWRAAWIARETRDLWISEAAPLLEPVGPAAPAHGLVSLLLADVARCFRAGATTAEILARYGERSEEGESGDGADLASLAEKLATQSAWEAEHYMTAMAT